MAPVLGYCWPMLFDSLSKDYAMHRTLLVIALIGLLTAPNGRAADPQPPKGFTAIFNGKDLTGWHGWAIHGPGGSPIEKLTYSEWRTKAGDWDADAKKHWSAQDGELVNDGHGAYLATDKEYGDIEF